MTGSCLPRLSEKTLNGMQARILEIVRTQGPVSDKAIRALYSDRHWPWVPTMQSIRCSLVQMALDGHVRAVGFDPKWKWEAT